MSYRSPSDAPDEHDPEAAAIEELGRRAGRMRLAFVVPLLVLAMAGSVALYVGLRAFQVGVMGGHIPFLTGVGAFVPMFGGALWLAPRLADVAVRRRLPAWRAELAAKGGLDLPALEETTKPLE